MFAVRIHGRGGQGAVTAAEMLSVAAFDEGRHAQAFPTFGSERTGAPVVAFCRIDDRPIRFREPITDPDAVIVQDPTLLHQVNLFAGLEPDGFLLVNTSRRLGDLGLDDLGRRLPPTHAIDRPGHGDRPRAPGPATAERGAARGVRRTHGAWSPWALCARRSASRFPGAVGEGNARAAAVAHEHVASSLRRSADA